MAQLEERELKYLIGTLRLVSHKWRQLAIQLEVQEVDIIEKNHPNDVERCLEDTLKRWLKSDKSNAEILVSALVNIGEIGHAEEIRKKYNCPNGERERGTRPVVLLKRPIRACTTEYFSS